MTWLRLDDSFSQHPKIIRLSKIQRWIWVEILCYCARFRTEGRVPTEVREVVPSADKKLLKRLVEVGLLDEDGDAWKVHDWEEYNPSDPTAAERAKRYRDRNANRDATVTEGVTDTVTRTAPRARASAPVPVPSPSSYSSSVVNGADDESIKKQLIQLARSDQQGLDWLKAYHDNPERIRGLLVTARSGATSNVGGYLATLIANGSEPGSDTKPVDQRILTALLRWVCSPAFDPETMTEDTVLDEIRLRETKLHGHLAVEQRLQVLDAATAKRGAA